MRPSQYRSINHRDSKPSPRMLQDMSDADENARKARSELRAKFSQGDDDQRKAALAASMGYGVEVVARTANVLFADAMVLVTGRTK
jgi:hypothetical protein